MYPPHLPIFIGIGFLCLGHGAGQTTDEPVSRVKFSSDYGHQTYFAGNKTRFVCHAEGGKPQPTVRFLLGSDHLDRGEERQDYWPNHVTATLTIVLSGDMDGQELSCEADNGIGKPVTATVTLHVRHSSIVSVKYNPDTRVVSCKATGNPAKQKFLGWQLQVGNVTLPLASNAASATEAWSLQLNEPDFDDTGVYMCSATNGLGPAGTGQLLIQPWSAPRFMQQIGNQQANQYSNVTISFNMYSSPLVTQYSWKKDDLAKSSVRWEMSFQETNLTLSVRGGYIELPGQYVTLELFNASLADMDNYSLTLTTSHGDSSTVDFTLVVIEQEMISTPAIPVTYEGGLGAGIIVLIVVVIVNVIVCLICIVYWRARIRSRQKEKDKKFNRLPEKSKFLPNAEKSDPPIPPKRTSSARRVQPKRINSTDSHYAELEFGQQGTNSNKILRREPPTEYAWIDFKRTALQPPLSEFP